MKYHLQFRIVYNDVRTGPWHDWTDEAPCPPQPSVEALVALAKPYYAATFETIGTDLPDQIVNPKRVKIANKHSHDHYDATLLSMPGFDQNTQFRIFEDDGIVEEIHPSRRRWITDDWEPTMK